jgi:large conductance mechanosensitive channel
VETLKNAAASSAPAQKAVSFWEEFRNFAFKGNMIDLAVGIVIGAAFGKIIDALVKSIIMPLIGLLIPGEQSYRDWTWVINGQSIRYGEFLAEVVNFLIVALAVFLFIVKFLGWVMRRNEAAPLTRDQLLLTEIRDLLQKQQTPPEAERSKP